MLSNRNQACLGSVGLAYRRCKIGHKQPVAASTVAEEGLDAGSSHERAEAEAGKPLAPKANMARPQENPVSMLQTLPVSLVS